MFEPKYTITPLILSNIAEIAEIKGAVERSRVLPLNEAQLRRQAILRMAHTSTSIEGNRLAEFEVGKIIEGKDIRGPQKDILEVQNYYNAIKLLDKMAESDSFLTVSEVLDLHRAVINGLVEKEKVGKFRPSSIYILNDLGDGREQLLYKGPDAKKVPALVEELIEWVKKARIEGIHPIVIAAIFHLHYVRIHPFTDGNGRTARLLTQLILYRMGWDFRKIIVLEDYYNRDRQSYLSEINQVTKGKYNPSNDHTTWVEYFTQGFLVEARKALEQIQSIGFGQASEKSKQIFLDRDEIQIMDFLTTVGKITSDDVMDILPIAKRTAQLKLKGLVDKELITVQGKGPATFYTLKQ